MAKIMEEQVIPAKTRTVQVGTVCDICAAVTKRSYGNWASADQTYGLEEVTIRYESGHRFPEGPSGEIVSFDICPDCFEDKVVPALAALGAKPTVTDVDG